MIQYGSDRVYELKFNAYYPKLERRNDQWVDIDLKLVLSPDTPAPAETTDLTALVICTVHGVIAQIVPLDEGCDCEFQFTADEKAQITAYIESPMIQTAIAKLSLPAR
ncbi:hypothetical protein [Paenibacillus spongiae]|uniref:Uncharacterized protein n=1 Tax=Paenibacillus spongiae TaxID=2909671 RepID=A0ABY5S1B5_9BACL|nr:hypothetical protein [Paenibacillus spongiae]UVI27652.1 hypothetical protein L1F29_19490 [Paenibacillus spongiae]